MKVNKNVLDFLSRITFDLNEINPQFSKMLKWQQLTALPFLFYPVSRVRMLNYSSSATVTLNHLPLILEAVSVPGLVYSTLFVQAAEQKIAEPCCLHWLPLWNEVMILAEFSGSGFPQTPLLNGQLVKL